MRAALMDGPRPPLRATPICMLQEKQGAMNARLIEFNGAGQLCPSLGSPPVLEESAPGRTGQAAACSRKTAWLTATVFVCVQCAYMKVLQQIKPWTEEDKD